MATVSITGTDVDHRTGVPIEIAEPRVSESITSSASSQQSTNTFLAGEHVTVTASGGAVWVAFGANPTAAAGTTHLVTDGQTRAFFNRTTDQAKVAIIDA